MDGLAIREHAYVFVGWFFYPNPFLMQQGKQLVREFQLSDDELDKLVSEAITRAAIPKPRHEVDNQ